MNREILVRFCERVGLQYPRDSPTCVLQARPGSAWWMISRLMRSPRPPSRLSKLQHFRFFAPLHALRDFCPRLPRTPGATSFLMLEVGKKLWGAPIPDSSRVGIDVDLAPIPPELGLV
jgi:hypothetical protein